MSKKVNVSALAGRVIERVTVYHDDAENPLTLEIRCVGGQCFDFSATSVATTQVKALLYRDVKGNTEDTLERDFKNVGTVPYGEEIQ